MPVFFLSQGYLRPSRELLEFYRRKIAQYDTERDDMVQKLDRCKVAYEEKVTVPFSTHSELHVCLIQHKLDWELRKRESEIVELQKAISDLQIYLFQEREQVLRLYAENDRLKVGRWHAKQRTPSPSPSEFRFKSSRTERKSIVC